MIFRVTHRAPWVTGSTSTRCQLVSPVQVGLPRPSQCMKLRTTTPPRGTTAKATKNTSAGSASRRLGPGRETFAVDAISDHFPIVAFMLVENCCGVICRRNSLSRLVSSASAWAGESAWSQESWKCGALLASS